MRGQINAYKLDGIYRPMKDDRRFSTHMEEKVRAVAAELMQGVLRVEIGKSKLVQTRGAVERSWRTISNLLLVQGQRDLSHDVSRFLDEMPPPKTEKEQIAAKLLQYTKEQRVKEKSRVR